MNKARATALAFFVLLLYNHESHKRCIATHNDYPCSPFCQFSAKKCGDGRLAHTSFWRGFLIKLFMGYKKGEISKKNDLAVSQVI